MKYRVDLSAHYSIVVEADDEFEAGRLAEEIVNADPTNASFFEVDDGGVNEVDEND